MRKRLVSCMVAVVVAFVGLSARLYTISNEELIQASYRQSTQTQTFAVSRGTIYDRYGQPLVNRRKQIAVSVAPYDDCVERITKAPIGARKTSVLETLSKGERASFRTDSWLSPTIGLVQVSAPIRYESDQIACHVIGYIDDSSHGVTGVERSFDEVLSTFVGQADVSYVVDALGRISGNFEDILENTLDKSVGGVVLTLDRQIQTIVQQAASDYMERGAVVVLDAQNSEILASVSLPLYDPNNVEHALEDERSPLLDRTTIDYNLGSVFKIITAAAALESGVSEDTVFVCEGSVEVGGNRFYCHNRLGDGEQTMRQAMANSCNCYFIQLALEVGASAIYDLAVRAGISKAVSLTENWQTAGGVLPPRRDLSADAALANFAIGQGDLLVTPYHAALLMQAVANKGDMCAPSLLCGMMDIGGTITYESMSTTSERLFSAETATRLMNMLCDTVESGTGVAATPENGSAAGKTGTAQTGWEIDGEAVVQSWFCGCYPADNPQYVIAVLSENSEVSGKTAAPLFALIADELFAAGLVEIAIDKPMAHGVY